MSSIITIPDKANRFILQLAETKRSTKLLHFMAFEFGITYLQKSQLMFRMPVLIKHSSKLFIKNNPIPYRVT